MISDRESLFVGLLLLWSNWTPPSGVAPTLKVVVRKTVLTSPLSTFCRRRLCVLFLFTQYNRCRERKSGCKVEKHAH